jgi:5-methylcytosine-specific restriction enzyme subunit McrC
MLAYSWDIRFPTAIAGFESHEIPKPKNLFVKVLCDSVDRLIQRGLSETYCPEQAEMEFLRGRVCFGESLRSGAMSRNKLVCEHERLTSDNLENQILKMTLKSIIYSSDIDPSLVKRARRLYSHFKDLSSVTLSPRRFHDLPFDPSKRNYTLPLAVAKLLVDSGGLSQTQGDRKFLEYFRDERKMRILFENFVRNFLRYHLQPSLTVGMRRYKIGDLKYLTGQVELIPTMESDIVLESGNAFLVIDTKFTPNYVQNNRFGRSLNSAHIYQIYTYVKNFRFLCPNKLPGGMVLYPQAGEALNVAFSSSGCKFTFATIDLSKSWQDVETDLLSTVKDAFP